MTRATSTSCRSSRLRRNNDAASFSSPPARLGYRIWRLSVVSTEGPIDFARGRLRPERRDLLSTISGLSWREGLSAPRGVYPERSRGALRSRRRNHGWVVPTRPKDVGCTKRAERHGRVELEGHGRTEPHAGLDSARPGRIMASRSDAAMQVGERLP